MESTSGNKFPAAGKPLSSNTGSDLGSGSTSSGPGSSIANKTSSAHSTIDDLAGKAKPSIDKAASYAHDATDKLSDAANKATDWFNDKTSRMSEAEKKLMADTCKYVGENPLKAVGIALVAGAILARIL